MTPEKQAGDTHQASQQPASLIDAFRSQSHCGRKQLDHLSLYVSVPATMQ
jgi:hypothetical protein